LNIPPISQRSYSLFLGILILLLTGNSSAADRSALEQLAKDPVWLTLLHYEKHPLLNTYKSSVITSAYFLSPNGRTSPSQELAATIAALEAATTNTDTSVQCRFPARSLWLSKKLNKTYSHSPAECKAWQEWAGLESVDSLSMVFAAGHMKSPASYFGHNFLKINNNTLSGGNHLLDQTINFGAEVPPNEIGVTYFYNGIFGGYSAIFERQQFYRHLKQYGEEDLRDIWEYVLDLEPDEVEFIIAHLWELQNHKLTYYFFRENCAYQIAKLLGFATPAQLVPRYMPWTMPYNVFANLAEAKIGDRKLIGKILYHPSRRSKFHQGYFSLTSEQKKLVNGAVTQSEGTIENNTPFDSESFNGLAEQQQIAIVDTLIDYQEFRLRVDPDDAMAKAEKKELLIKRFGYPPGKSTTENKHSLNPPHAAQRPGYAAAGKITNSAFGNATELRLRPAYFDFLYQDIGRKSGGNFTLLDTSLLVHDSSISLRTLDLINITNLSASITGLPGDSALSWHVRLGFDHTNGACLNCRRPMFDFTVGRSRKLTAGLTAYGLAGTRLQNRYQQDRFAQDNPVALRLTAGVTGQISRNLRVNAVLERHEDTGRLGLDRNRLAVNLRLGSHHSWDIRLRYVKDIAEEFGLSAGYYW